MSVGVGQGDTVRGLSWIGGGERHGGRGRMKLVASSGVHNSVSWAGVALPAAQRDAESGIGMHIIVGNGPRVVAEMRRLGKCGHTRYQVIGHSRSWGPTRGCVVRGFPPPPAAVVLSFCTSDHGRGRLLCRDVVFSG